MPVTPSGSTWTLTVPETSPVDVSCMINTWLFASGYVFSAVFKLNHEPPMMEFTIKESAPSVRKNASIGWVGS